MADLKWCRACKMAHDRQEFARDKSRADGLRYECRASRATPRRSLAERLSRKTAPGPNGCILWTGAKGEFGHGNIWAGGRLEGVHRVAWALSHGPVPAGLCVLHRCDVPACVNIEHLFLGTKGDNAADMAAKGRASRRPGEHAPRAKLTEEQVLEIRRLRGIVSQQALAHRYGVTKTAVRYAQIGRNWKYLQEIPS